MDSFFHTLKTELVRKKKTYTGSRNDSLADLLQFDPLQLGNYTSGIFSCGNGTPAKISHLHTHVKDKKLILYCWIEKVSTNPTRFRPSVNAVLRFGSGIHAPIVRPWALEMRKQPSRDCAPNGLYKRHLSKISI